MALMDTFVDTVYGMKKSGKWDDPIVILVVKDKDALCHPSRFFEQNGMEMVHTDAGDYPVVTGHFDGFRFDDGVAEGTVILSY